MDLNPGLQKIAKLLVWNTYCENSDTNRITACLERFKPDIVVLCEATKGHIEAVSRQYPYVAHARDYIQDGVICYLVIAANTPLREVDLASQGSEDKQPASWLARKKGWVEVLDTIAASFPALGFRVLCLHLSAGCGPTRRRGELEAAAMQISSDGPFIVAGDFNSFSSPWISPFVAFPLRYQCSDWLKHEREANNSWFLERGFIAAVDGITFPRFRFRLDQVYLRGMTIVKSAASIDCWGSDHRPIIVEVAVP